MISRKKTIPGSLLLWLLAPGVSAVWTVAGLQPDRSANRITVVSNARLRQSPQLTAEEIVRLPLGAIVRVFEQSPERELIGGIEDFWYRVETTDGVSGWVFGGLTVSFSPARREEIYLRIVRERMNIGRNSFPEQTDLFNFLTRAIAEVKTRAVVAEFELAQLLALSNSLRAIPFQRNPEQQYLSWIKAHEARIVYSEPGGMWLVRLDGFWELEKEYRALPIGERIAWEAAQYGLPGECEGYLPCYFATILLREGVYLRLYPSGAHVGEAIGRIDGLLKSFADDLTRQWLSEIPKEDRHEFKKQITELRSVLTKAASPNKVVSLKRLDQLSRAIP